MLLSCTNGIGDGLINLNFPNKSKILITVSAPRNRWQEREPGCIKPERLISCYSPSLITPNDDLLTLYLQE